MKHTIRRARPSGGKAGKGHNKTSTMQVMNEDNCIVKQFRFLVGDWASEHIATIKATEWAMLLSTGVPKEYLTRNWVLKTQIKAGGKNG